MLTVEPMSPTPTFRVTVVSRSVQAVNYQHRSGASKVDFAGTDLMPGANGQAKVESKKGYIVITNNSAALSPFGGTPTRSALLVGGNFEYSWELMHSRHSNSSDCVYEGLSSTKPAMFRHSDAVTVCNLNLHM